MYGAKYWGCEAARYACWVEQDLRDGRHDRLECDFEELCEAFKRLGMQLPVNAPRRSA